MSRARLAAFAAHLPAAVVLAAASWAGTPPLPVDGALERFHAVGPGDLGGTVAGLVASGEPTWIAWAVPIVDGRRELCCGHWSRRALVASACRLDSRESTFHTSGSGAVSTQLIVVLGFDGGRLRRLRPVTETCRLDAEGHTLHWLEGVRPAESVAWMHGIVREHPDDEVREDALDALALHRDAAVTGILTDLAASRHEAGEAGELRERAAFWLGEARGRDGFLALRGLFADAQAGFRRALLFPLSVSGQPEAVPMLLRAARRDADPEVRSQALFWLADRAGDRIAEAIHDAVADDPSIEVKKEAVFALSRLEPGRAIPLLIDVARDNRSPEVRREALFWLGQTGDSRALRFIEELLTR